MCVRMCMLVCEVGAWCISVHRRCDTQVLERVKVRSNDVGVCDRCGCECECVDA